LKKIMWRIPLILVFLPGYLYAAVPIQEKNLKGEEAAKARFDLIQAAEAYLGTPYRYAGADKRGLDCSGLVYLSFRDAFSVKVPRTTGGLYDWAEKIETSGLRPGDLLFFITGGDGIISHVGIYTGNKRFIHAASEGPETGVIYSSLTEAYWKRSYASAGRALPWDDEAEKALAGGVFPGRPSAENTPDGDDKNAAARFFSLSEGGSGDEAKVKWSESGGVFTGFGLAFNFGGFFSGSPSVFRGLAFQAKIGYKGLFTDSFQIALEVRPDWDRTLNIFRLPFTLNLGTDIFQIFIGPGFTVGDPALDAGEGRGYHPAFAFLAELGIAGALPPVRIGSGALSFFGELVWQPYFRNEEESRNFAADLTASLRVSAGVRYLWLIRPVRPVS
jgi:probable lipoprotein NlpC